MGRPCLRPVLSPLLFVVQVRPLRKQLRTLDAWITGQRKDQSPGTRASVPVVQVDPAFEGLSGGPGSLVKFNPLANVKGTDLWNFLRLLNVPVNELHSQVRSHAQHKGGLQRREKREAARCSLVGLALLA